MSQLPKAPESQNECLKLWTNPSSAYRGKPFWSWNAALEIDELKRQVGVLQEMGMGGFFMHSRTGLETEYLGSKWFEAINSISDEGAHLGMEAWLYDEDRWPSGSAGGMATEDAAYRMRLLRAKILSECPIAWPEADYFVAAFVAELDGLNLGAYRSIEFESHPELQAGEVVLLFTWELMPNDSFYNGNSYLDTLNPEAVEHFLQLTHDRYAAECGERLGGAIPGIFTDEPHRGFVMIGDVWSAGAEDSAMTAPWTERLPEIYEREFGEPFLPRLPELYFRRNGEPVSPVKWRYMECLQRMFLDNWAKPCLERSRRHDLALTGHVLHEDTLGSQACPGGSVQRYYEYMDVPGIDLLGSKNPSFWVAKQVQSVARQMDKPWILSELYGCTGWQTGFDGHKRIGDWQALFGVNLRCHHLSWYSMKGEAKRDYPASIFFQSPWWKEYHVVETYFSRLNVVLQTGKPSCDVLVVNPVESIWAQIYPGWARWLESKDSDLLKLEAQYQKLFHLLSGAQIDFDYGDEDHIARFARIIDSEGGPLLELGSMRYRTIVVSVAVTLRQSTLSVLEAFVDKGGRVVFAGPVPKYVGAVPSEALKLLAKRAVCVDFEREALVDAIPRNSESRRLSLTPQCPGVFAQVRETGDGWYAVLVNTADNAVERPITLSFRGACAVEEWDALSGERTPLKAGCQTTELVWETTFDALKERVFYLSKAPLATQDPAPSAAALIADGDPEEIKAPFAYGLGEPNLMVLDRAVLEIEGEAASGPIEILQIESLLAERIGAPLRTGTMVQPWARKKESIPDEQKLPVALKFAFEVETLPEGPVELLIEQAEQFAIELNGELVHSDSRHGEWLIDPCLRRIALPTQQLRKGPNAVTLRCVFRPCFDLEAVYLCGTFGVLAAEGAVRMTQLPEALDAGSIIEQGLCFYSDRIFYEIPVSRTGVLEVTPLGAACVAFNGADGRKVIPWAPFRYPVTDADLVKGSIRCEVILTRRNTLGPLHHTDKDLSFVGPTSFRSSGDEWSDAHVLLPAGLASVRLHPIRR